MALPGLTVPYGTPPWMASEHGIELVSLYADVEVRTGHDRRRRVYTTAPRTVTVKVDATLAQTLAFHEWFEGALQAGALPFAAEVANQGPGLLWWKAWFAEPPTYEADAGGVSFWINGKLLLVGPSYTEGPYLPEMESTSTIRLLGALSVGTSSEFESESVIALGASNNMTSTSIVALLGPSYELRDADDGGGYELRDDGVSKERRED